MVYHKFVKPLSHSVDKTVVNTLSHDQTARCSTTLPSLEKRTVYGTKNRGVQVRIVEHHQRVLSAHFGLHPNHLLSCPLHDVASRLYRTSKGNRIYAIQDRLPNNSATTHHQIENPLRNAGLGDDLRQGPRRNLPSRNGNWKVPRCDDAHHSHRITRDLDVNTWSHRRQFFAANSNRFSCKETEYVCSASNLPNGFRTGFTLFPSKQLTQFFLAIKQLDRDITEDI